MDEQLFSKTYVFVFFVAFAVIVGQDNAGNHERNENDSLFKKRLTSTLTLVRPRKDRLTFIIFGTRVEVTWRGDENWMMTDGLSCPPPSLFIPNKGVF